MLQCTRCMARFQGAEVLLLKFWTRYFVSFQVICGNFRVLRTRFKPEILRSKKTRSPKEPKGKITPENPPNPEATKDP